ncbi:MAG: flavohemoglobin expression-modulating QEGLA motif protein [Bacteroidales bacterium]|nr:flavohemoglobin expression-modulating QEGLA motif protein [Bacteroidales bacterium]
MLNLTIEEIINSIKKGNTFEANAVDNSFYIKIDEYIPYVCAAIHNGNNLRDELKPKILLNDYERWSEEDPSTYDFISSLPIVIAANDSRYEYDINRDIDNCIYEEAWGKKVWKEPLTDNEKAISFTKHQNFYKVINALISKLEKKFNSCIVYDIHSYNYKRYDRYVPVFNIGTKIINTNKYEKFIRNWKKELSKIKLPNIENKVAINDVFLGKGYFLKYITENFDNTLVLATEVKKIYCNEETGDSFPEVISALKDNLKKAALNNAIYFANQLTNLKVKKKQKLLSSKLDEAIIKADKMLYNLAKDFEFLHNINPINFEEEKKRFFASKFINTTPTFKYSELAINAFDFKKKLYSIPVEKIKDINIQNLYKDVITSFANKIDLLSSRGNHNFLYYSLRYFGEPNENDVANAEFLLHCPKIITKNNATKLSVEQARKILLETADQYGFKCNIEYSNNIPANALVLNNKKTLLLKKNAKFTLASVKILRNHEIGVHMLTTINANAQPLRIFQLGLPNNTLTQEGLAILSEHLSGSLNLKRLKEIALRIIAIKLMLKGTDFRKTFLYLVEEYKMDFNSAFSLTTRVYRGGGFTKDFLYLRGFRDLLKYYKSGESLDNLLIGKTSIKYISTINEMIERKLILPPKFKTFAFENPSVDDPIINYLVEGIR